MMKIAGRTFPACGDWFFYPDDSAPERIVLGTPAGVVRLRIRRGADPGRIEGEHAWGWNGDLEKPTLTPSIDISGADAWHGHLKNGELIKA